MEEEEEKNIFDLLSEYISNTYQSAKESAANTTKDYTYAVMHTNNRGYVGGANRNLSQIISSIINKDDILKNRYEDEFSGRDLHSLYIYGNDLGRYKEIPELADYGVDYKKYLESVGKDPSKIKTYLGKFGDEDIAVILPKSLESTVNQYINSPHNRTFGVTIGGWNSTLDDVANHLRRFTYMNGKPYMINSDLWDFTPSEYSNTWKTSQLKAKLIDKMGTPFILKSRVPVKFVSDDTFYNGTRGKPYEEVKKDYEAAYPVGDDYLYTDQMLHQGLLKAPYDYLRESNPKHYTELFKEFGILPELIVTPKNK